MITLIKNFLQVFLWDETAARRWLYGLAGIAVTLATQLLVYGIDNIVRWTPTEWKQHLIVAASGLIIGMLPAPRLQSTSPAGSPAKGFADMRLLAILTISLGLLLGGCQFFKNLGEDAKSCAAKLYGDAKLTDAQEAVDAALRQDWANAEVSLLTLAGHYSYEFVTCVVADLRAQYGTVLLATDAGPPVAVHPRVAAHSGSSTVVAYDNAGLWLARGAK